LINIGIHTGSVDLTKQNLNEIERLYGKGIKASDSTESTTASPTEIPTESPTPPEMFQIVSEFSNEKYDYCLEPLIDGSNAATFNIVTMPCNISEDKQWYSVDDSRIKCEGCGDENPNMCLTTETTNGGEEHLIAGLCSTKAIHEYIFYKSFTNMIMMASSSADKKFLTVPADGPESNNTINLQPQLGDIPDRKQMWHLLPILERRIEKQILIKFYHSTGGTGWKENAGWLTNQNVCNWHGVTCEDNDEIIELVLKENNLIGTIPSEIGMLTNLRRLILSNNKFSSNIPSQIGQLSNLADLHLYMNKISFTIPSQIGQLTNLENLWLYGNKLSSTIPSEIAQLTNLSALKLHKNNLTGNISSNFPSQTGQLKNLDLLFLDGNNLTGNMDPIFCNPETIPYITADCVSKVTCSCCTFCF